VEKDRALERRFQSILVNEPLVPTPSKSSGSQEELRGIPPLSITDGAVEAAVHLSKRYITERYLPDKAIDVLDEAAAGKSLQAALANPELKKLEEKLEQLLRKQQEAVRDQKYHLALKLKQEQQNLREQIEQMQSNADGDRRTPRADYGG
jgi:ATP-dependent Clp protease ATP-binding subunit ClpC